MVVTQHDVLPPMLRLLPGLRDDASKFGTHFVRGTDSRISLYQQTDHRDIVCTSTFRLSINLPGAATRRPSLSLPWHDAKYGKKRGGSLHHRHRQDHRERDHKATKLNPDHGAYSSTFDFIGRI